VFYSVRAALHSQTDSNRFSHRKNSSYFAILLDNNVRKPIVRLYFDQKRKAFEVFDDFKNPERYEFTKLQDIYDHLQEMIESIEIYDNKRQPDPTNSRKRKPILESLQPCTENNNDCN
jgi:hypothetical protein